MSLLWAVTGEQPAVPLLKLVNQVKAAPFLNCRKYGLSLFPWLDFSSLFLFL
jgi:hypothetical protein